MDAVTGAFSYLTGLVRRDVLLTAEELAGLEAGPVSELARNFRPYDPL